MQYINTIFEWLLPVLHSVAILTILIGAFYFVVSIGSPERKMKAKRAIVCGVVIELASLLVPTLLFYIEGIVA